MLAKQSINSRNPADISRIRRRDPQAQHYTEGGWRGGRKRGVNGRDSELACSSAARFANFKSKR